MPEAPSARTPGARAPNVRLALANTPLSVAVVHEAIAALARQLRLDAVATDGLQTATGEACKNVVLHAYEGQDGPLEVEIETGSDAVEVAVRDHGIGIRPHLGERRQPHNGLGMPIIHLLTRRLTFLNLPDGGTELRMLFELPGVVSLPGCAAPASLPAQLVSPGEQLEAALAPASLCGVYVPTLLPALARAAGVGETPLLGPLAEELSLATRALDGPVTIAAQPDGGLRVEGLPEDSAVALVEALRSNQPTPVGAARLDDAGAAGRQPAVVVAL